MPKIRKAPPTDAKKAKPQYINGTLYSAEATHSSSVQVLTDVPREENDRVYRFPCYETVLDTLYANRECRVSIGVTASGKREVFIVVAQYQPNAPVNVALSHVCPGVDWRGSILVMKAGSKFFVTNMRAGDFDKARRAVRTFLFRMEDELTNARANNTTPIVPLEI
ncbi:hypothetical protein EIP86_008933 [Pleurotus ostreatoroseus]|nr:hypothetical protein EIP86_008933 [Pleurotus ostreatoroseus]